MLLTAVLVGLPSLVVAGAAAVIASMWARQQRPEAAYVYVAVATVAGLASSAVVFYGSLVFFSDLMLPPRGNPSVYGYAVSFALAGTLTWYAVKAAFGVTDRIRGLPSASDAG